MFQQNMQSINFTKHYIGNNIHGLCADGEQIAIYQTTTDATTRENHQLLQELISAYKNYFRAIETQNYKGVSTSIRYSDSKYFVEMPESDYIMGLHTTGNGTKVMQFALSAFANTDSNMLLVDGLTKAFERYQKTVWSRLYK